MGLSSNQARFLSITARQCDLEHRMQNICHRRLKLSNSLQSAARAYDAQTSDRKLYINSINTDSYQTTGDYQLIDDGNGTASVGRLNTQGYEVYDTKNDVIIGKSFSNGDVIEVNSAAALRTAITNKADAKIVLTDNFDFSGAAISGFTGTLYGNGYQINTTSTIFDNIAAGSNVYDLKLNVAAGASLGSSNNAGFLANTNSGNIDNVIISGSAVNASGITSTIGALVGTNDGTIADVYSSLSLHGNNSVGGIAGVNNGSISAATIDESAVIQGDGWRAGGIAGVNNGTIGQSSVLANVSVGQWGGGIVGENTGDVNSCFSSGTINAGTDKAGGLVGINNAGAEITDSYSISSITGSGDKGALAGANNGTIGSSNVAILSEAGTNIGVTGSGTGTTNAQIIGNLTANNIDTVLEPTLSSAWDKSATAGTVPVLKNSGVTTTNGADSNFITTEEVTQKSIGSGMTVLTDPSSLTLTNDVTMYNGLSALYATAIANGDAQIVKYKAALPTAIQGEYEYKEIVSLAINNASALQDVRIACNSVNGATKTAALSANYVLNSDVDLGVTSGTNWDAIGDGTEGFKGAFDGNQHTIDNLTIRTAGDATYQGMFGNINSTGKVMGINLDNEIIVVNGKSIQAVNAGNFTPGYVGGLAGFNTGTVENCHVDANIEITQYGNQIGGVVGACGGGTVNKCSSAGTLTINSSNSPKPSPYDTYNNFGVDTGDQTEYSQIGGLAGWLTGGAITFSSTSMNIVLGTGYDAGYIGPMVGDLDSSANPSLDNCYATNSVKTTTGTDLNYHNIASAVNHQVIQNSYYKNSVDNKYYYYPNTSSGVLNSACSSIGDKTNVSDLPFINDVITINSSTGTETKNIWNADGTLNPDASNTVKVNNPQKNVSSAGASPSFTEEHKFTKNVDYTPVDMWGQTTPPTLDANVSLEEGLRSGRYQLLVPADQMTQNVMTPSNSGVRKYEAVDWRTETIISDELYEANDAEAQTIYDRTIRDVNEQDKLLQMEQEKVTTEYQAITSEKEAVKKILSTNSQTSFKYFS